MNCVEMVRGTRAKSRELVGLDIFIDKRRMAAGRETLRQQGVEYLAKVRADGNRLA